MNGLVFIVSSVITFAALIILDILLILRNLQKNKDVEKLLGYMQYMISFLFPIACFAIILQHWVINTLLCALLWIVIFEVSNRILSYRLLCHATLDMKVAMSFLVMLLCVVYFGAQAILNWSEEYLGMMFIIIALMLGFFVPIEILVSNLSLQEKGKEILKTTKLAEITKGTWISYFLTIIYFVIYAIVDKIGCYSNYFISMHMGLIVGVFAALPVIVVLSKMKANALKDCYDTRKDIFKSQEFLRYKRKVENFLNYTDKERYDYVEAFMFYEAFVSICDKSGKCEANSMFSVCEHIWKEYSYCSEMIISQRYPDNENIYVLKKGKRKFCCSVMTSPLPLFKEYLRTYNGIALEDGNVPKKERVRYASQGFERNIEMWLLYFLENYHRINPHKKKEIIPKEVRSFLINAYREEAVWLNPIGCNLSKMRRFVGPSIIEEKYAFGDLTLKAIYEWYNISGEESEHVEKLWKDYFGGNQAEFKACEAWLQEFSSWNDFVVSNKLQKMVKKSKNIFVEKYGEPILYFKNHSINNLLPISQRNWLKMFKRMSSMIYHRY